LKGLDIIGTQP